MRSRVYRSEYGDWHFDCPVSGPQTATFDWWDAMESFWGHEMMYHSPCPDCRGTGCSDCAWRNWGHDQCYCVYCGGIGVVCST